MVLKIGSHVSNSGNDMLLGSVKEAFSYGANGFMVYTGAPQNKIRKPIDKLKIPEAKELMALYGIDINDVIIHAPYIINLANKANPSTYRFAVDLLKEELSRTAAIGAKVLVLHPGSHVNLGKEVGLNQLIKGLNEVLESDSSDVKIALETMAGKGGEIGATFEELKYVFDNVSFKERLGVCLDTCHIFDAGYDIINDFEGVMSSFDSIIGLNNILAIHLNDSKNGLGSHKDRHENIGLGNIGFETLLKVAYYDKLAHVMKILETPYVSVTDGKAYPPYSYEIDMLKNKTFKKGWLNNVTT